MMHLVDFLLLYMINYTNPDLIKKKNGDFFGKMQIKMLKKTQNDL